MQTEPLCFEDLTKSVIAVPPLARSVNGEISLTENAKIIKHVEAGGVTTLLYGGNANLYHIRPSEYSTLLEILSDSVSEKTLVIPSVGPAFGMMMDQAERLADSDFPTAMVLPQNSIKTEIGLATGFRNFVEKFGKPAVLYLKSEHYLSPLGVSKLIKDGLVSFVKYAIVKENIKEDYYLDELLSLVDRRMVVSGSGEQASVCHVSQYGLAGFTSGCVCVAPHLSQHILRLLYSDKPSDANEPREIFAKLEALRQKIDPIRVLHDAIRLSGIADTGPQMPYLEKLNDTQAEYVGRVTRDLLAANETFAATTTA